MPDKEFNLLHEPWILVMKQDGTTGEVSILDAFRHAHEYRSIAGELPTQDVVVLRLLLAIMHAVFGRVDIQGNSKPLCDGDTDLAIDRWTDLWNLKQFPMEPIEAYLTKYEERFWLFHPKTPFYQVAALVKDKTVFGPFKMSKLNGDILESNGKARLFSSRAGDNKHILSYSEAARWILHVIGYAEDFGMLEAKGKKSKDDPSIGVGWVGKIGSVMAQGHNLFSTLMLNFVLLKDGEEKWGSEKPVWERDSTEPVLERNSIPCPDNPSELLSNLPRQILLLRGENGTVSEYVFLSGSFFPKESAFSEQFTIWRYTKDPGDKQPQFRPKTFDAERQIWRGFATFVIQNEGARKPGLISWLSKLREAGCFKSKLITFKTSSPQYGTMSASISDYACDFLAFDPKILTKMGVAWCNRIVKEIETTDILVQQLSMLARNIAKSAGSESGAGEADEARRQAYYELDMLFRHWLEALDPEVDDIDERSNEWWGISQKMIRRMGKKIAETSGPKSLIGRVDATEKIPSMTSAEAYNLFLYKTSSPSALIRKGGKNDRSGKKA